MKATGRDYDRALAVFVARMRDLGDDLKSVLLYGSVARSDFSPGKSDLLDAYVFVSQRALAPVISSWSGFVALTLGQPAFNSGQHLSSGIIIKIGFQHDSNFVLTHVAYSPFSTEFARESECP